MVWNFGARLWVSVSVAGLSITAGAACGSDQKMSIQITAPLKDAELTLKNDDLDTDRIGLQYDVKATADGAANGTRVLLTIEDESDTAVSTVSKDGSIVFEHVTLPPGKHTLKIDAASGNAHSANDYSYTYRALLIDTPHNGAAIGFPDDTDSMSDGIQIVVTATAYAVEPSEDVSLLLDNTQVGKATHVDAKGKLVFSGVTLTTGSHMLQVVSGNAESDTILVSVNEGCANVEFVTPRPPVNGDPVVLGGGDSCPAAGADFTINVDVSTDAADGGEADLRVNGTTVQSTKVNGSLAHFSNVVLNHRTSSNAISVIVQGAQGATCKEVAFPADVIVNCQGSDCSIGSPDPKPGLDAVGQRVLYLNRSKLDKGGFDIRVDTDTGVLGKPVQLIVDRDDRNALSSNPKQVGSSVSAQFNDVKFAEGAHTVEARCEDNSGNVRFSGETTWIIDTKPCSNHITAPAADALLLPSDDVDSNSNGVQAHVISNVGGNDCADTRAAVCTPSQGIADSVPFTTYDGDSTLVSTLTLSTSPAQTLCVEVRDRADNRALDSVPVQFRSAPPKVLIETPANHDSFNAQGDSAHKSDSDPSSPTVCNANFSVLCTELGSAVELHRDAATNPVIAMGTCVKDSGVPSGFAGRARLSNVEFLADNSTMGKVVATQQVNGANQNFEATASIDLTGWCQIPSIDFFLTCPASQIELPSAGADVSVGTLIAAYAGNPSFAPANATLTVSGSASGRIGADYTSALMADRYKFDNVSFGHTAEAISTQLTATDTFDNTVQRTCMTQLVPDLPDLTVTSPSNGAVFGPGDGCSSGVTGQYGVPVALTLDKASDRTLTYTVGSGSAVSVPVSGTSMTLCVPANDGPSSINVRLASTHGMGYDAVTLTVAVRSVALSLPPTGGSLTADDDACDPGFGAHVTATTDAIHDGAAVTISNGTNTVHTTVSSSGAIDACLPLAQGINTITVSVDGTTATASSTVTVASTPPSHAIPITTVSLPADNVYRTGKVHLAWSTPAQDFAGQLQKYELRCASAALRDGDTDANKQTWWNAAESVALPMGFAPPASAVDVEFRIGETRECVLRGRDVAQQLTPIPGSKTIGYAFRTRAVDTTDSYAMGTNISRVGDINGDGVNDILVGGTGRAYLYFGNGGGLATKPAPGNPDVTFVGAPGVASYEFGSRTVAIGDWNRDGRNDFAIAAPSANGNRGAVYVFYGRVSTDSWPTTVDLTGSVCGADVCFVGEQAAELLGFALSPAGDFDADGNFDFALSALGRDVGTDTSGGRLYVLLSHTYEGSGSRANNFWGVQLGLPSGDPVGFYIDGTGPVSGGDSANVSQLGQSIAAVGNIDANPGDDLLFSSAGSTSPSVTAKLFFLSGRAHDGLAPQLKTLATSEAKLRDSGPANVFAQRLIAERNVVDATGNDIPDVAVAAPSQAAFSVYLGDANASSVTFAADTRVTVNGATATRFANSVAMTYNPNLSTTSVGDLDSDGLDELLVGTADAPGSTNAGFAYLFYGDVFANGLSSKAVSYTIAAKVDPSPRHDTLGRVVQYVGDVTGDNAPDLVVSDPDANGGSGGFTVLY